MKIIVGSRGSDLALTQTNMVIREIEEKNPGVKCEVKIIKTKGDTIYDKPIDQIGGKEIFTKEIEHELLAGRVDMAIHSMKDMPGELPQGLKLSYTPKREDPRDVLVLKEGYGSLDDIPQGGIIGTGSKRRKFQLLKMRPDLKIVGIRGNIQTRIDKIESENLDGTLLAAAGINRLDIDLSGRMQYLGVEEFLPSPTQGILAIEIREDDKKIEEVIEKISHPETEIQARAEREFLKAVGGSCTVPVAAYSTIEGDKIYLEGFLGSVNGDILLREKITGKIDDQDNIGKKLGEKMLKEMDGR